ncbi:hypothetical protein KA005_55575, partial [bacterium]|nr:hypothetical protein [bacterium]
MKERTSKTSISRILIIFILPALFLFGCGDSDDSDDCTKVDIPTVTFSCDAATDCSDNSADDNGGDFIVYFIENGGICGATGIPTAITYAIGYVILTAGNCSN